jgi:hypothetical protein
LSVVTLLFGSSINCCANPWEGKGNAIEEVKTDRPVRENRSNKRKVNEMDFIGDAVVTTVGPIT